MTQIEIGPDRIEVDAGIVAEGLRIDEEQLKQAMRDGEITSRFERGEGEDSGRVRLTFFSATRRVRLTADDSGKILMCSAIDYGDRPRGVSGTPAR